MIPLHGAVFVDSSLTWRDWVVCQAALDVGGLTQMTVYAPAGVPMSAEWSDKLAADTRVTVETLTVDRACEWAGTQGTALAQIMREVAAKGRCDVAAWAWLNAHGGFVIARDALVLDRLDDIALRSDFVCGERTCAGVRAALRTRNVKNTATAALRAGTRAALSRLPAGHRVAQQVQPLLGRTPSTALRAAPAKHPFVQAALETVVRTPVQQRRTPAAFGARTLQATLVSHHRRGVVVLPPSAITPFVTAGDAQALASAIVVSDLDALADGVPLSPSFIRTHPDHVVSTVLRTLPASVAVA